MPTLLVASKMSLRLLYLFTDVVSLFMYDVLRFLLGIKLLLLLLLLYFFHYKPVNMSSLSVSDWGSSSFQCGEKAFMGFPFYHFSGLKLPDWLIRAGSVSSSGTICSAGTWVVWRSSCPTDRQCCVAMVTRETHGIQPSSMLTLHPVIRWVMRWSNWPLPG